MQVILGNAQPPGNAAFCSMGRLNCFVEASSYVSGVPDAMFFVEIVSLSSSYLHHLTITAIVIYLPPSPPLINFYWRIIWYGRRDPPFFSTVKWLR
jgi:hypothetical protein